MRLAAHHQRAEEYDGRQEIKGGCHPVQRYQQQGRSLLFVKVPACYHSHHSHDGMRNGKGKGNALVAQCVGAHQVLARRQHNDQLRGWIQHDEPAEQCFCLRQWPARPEKRALVPQQQVHCGHDSQRAQQVQQQ